MRTFARALQIVALLLGFYALCVLLIAGLIVLDVLAVKASDHVPGLGRFVAVLVVATIGACVIVLRGVFVSTRVRRRHLPGIVVSRTDEPALWQRVVDLARAAGTRPPREIRLAPDVNAAVMENAHLVGLLPGKRRMIIGVPLLLSLPLPQFDAVIGHELGHYSGRDVRLGPLTARTRQSVLSALRAVHGKKKAPKKPGKRQYRLRWPGHQVFAAIFTAYANLVFTATYAAGRRQELAADRFAVSIAGRENAAAALREIPVIDASYDFYLDRYVGAGLAVGLLPPPSQVLGGFGDFIGDPRRSSEMSELRDAPREETAHKYDSHPPTSERVAAILALPDDGRGLDESAVRAVSLLADPDRVLTAVGVSLLGDQAAGKTTADWETIARAVGVTSAKERARPLVDVVGSLIGRPPRVADLLDLVDAGRLDEVLDKIPPSEAARRTKATGRAAREFAKTALGSMLGGWAVTDLIQGGRVSIRHDWSQVSGEPVMPDGLGEALDKGIEAVIAMDPEAAPLREALAEREAKV
jgi:Zn-dependent protease with chaperone function